MSDRIGEKLVMESLRSRGITVQYRRLRRSLERVDPIFKSCEETKTDSSKAVQREGKQ